MTLPTEIVKLAQHIMEMIAEGLSPAEISKRIADPLSVGHKMLRRAAERRALAEAYIPGRRDPEAVNIEIVSTPKNPPRAVKKKKK